MKKHVRFSAVALAAITLFGTLFNQSDSGTVYADSYITLPITPLAELTDSLRLVSMGLDATIKTLQSTDSTLRANICAPVQSIPLQRYCDSLAAEPKESLPRITKTHFDAFALKLRISAQQVIVSQLTNRLEQMIGVIENLPTLIPCDGEHTSGFGGRFHPILHRHKMHTGVDLSAPRGTPILAAGGGIVVFAGRKSSYGNVVEIDHGLGYSTLYAHASRLLVTVGDTVPRGTTIALVGSTGRSTGPHLHYETIVDSMRTDPQPFLIDSGNGATPTWMLLSITVPPS